MPNQPSKEKRTCKEPEIPTSHCTGFIDINSEGTHAGCTVEHGHVGCEIEKRDRNGHRIDSKGKLVFDEKCEGCDSPKENKEINPLDLALCKECMQMTNHKGNICLKCKSKEKKGVFVPIG